MGGKKWLLHLLRKFCRPHFWSREARFTSTWNSRKMVKCCETMVLKTQALREIQQGPHEKGSGWGELVHCSISPGFRGAPISARSHALASLGSLTCSRGTEDTFPQLKILKPHPFPVSSAATGTSWVLLSPPCTSTPTSQHLLFPSLCALCTSSHCRVKQHPRSFTQSLREVKQSPHLSPQPLCPVVGMLTAHTGPKYIFL